MSLAVTWKEVRDGGEPQLHHPVSLLPTDTLTILCDWGRVAMIEMNSEEELTLTLYTRTKLPSPWKRWW